MSKTTKAHQNILDYLQRIPLFPFNPDIDPEFVEEIVEDFASVINVLDETKAFRWYHADQATAQLRNPRLSLRRWLNNARKPRRHRES